MSRSLCVFLPLLGVALTQGPVLRFDLFPRWRRPLDGGRTFRGRRIFGDNKTWRGAIAMWAGTLGGALLLWLIPDYVSCLPEPIQAAGPFAFGALLGLGVVVGELPNSFVKRQLGIAPGAQRRSPLGVLLSIVDQGDFVFGAWATLAPIWVMPLADGALAFAVVAGGHLAVSGVGYAVGARKTWL